MVSPRSGEVCIRVAHCGVCGTDLHIFLGHMDRRVRLPQVMGHEMSGEIAEVGPDVSGWEKGDRVVVRPLAPCGGCPACLVGHAHICHNLKFLGIDTPGAFQEYWTVPVHTLHRLADTVSLDEAAMIEPIAVACHDVRLGQVGKDENVVVIGGGPIGALNGMVAKALGARVLVSEVNPFRIDLLRRIGLEAVNPTETDLPALVRERTGGRGADVVFEVSGSQAGARVMTELTRTRGRIVVVAIFSEPPGVDLHRVFWRELHIRGARVYEPEDFDQAIQLISRRAVPFQELITDQRPLSALQATLEEMAAGADIMKVLIAPGDV